MNTSPKSDREKLAEYQARLLDLLYDKTSVVDAKPAVQELLRSLGLHDSHGELDDRMIDVALELTKKWGLKNHESQE